MTGLNGFSLARVLHVSYPCRVLGFLRTYPSIYTAYHMFPLYTSSEVHRFHRVSSDSSRRSPVHLVLCTDRAEGAWTLTSRRFSVQYSCSYAGAEGDYDRKNKI